jgi:hypothetical protein
MKNFSIPKQPVLNALIVAAAFLTGSGLTAGLPAVNSCLQGIASLQSVSSEDADALPQERVVSRSSR